MSASVVISVRVSPRSSRDAIEGVDADGALHVRVMAPPGEGAANAAVIRLVAKTLGVPRSAISLASGAGSRRKRLRIEGASRDAVARRWPGARMTG